MLNDIPFFHSGVQIAPFPRAHCHLLTLPPLRTRPPARQNSTSRLRHIQELLKIRQRVVSVVEPAGIAGEVVVILDTHAIAVNELAESIFLGELVEVAVLADILEKVAGHFGHGVEVGCSLWLVLRTGLLRRATEWFVGFPIEFLAVTAAVPLVLAFGAAFERYVCLSPLASGADFLSEIHCREMVKRRRYRMMDRLAVDALLSGAIDLLWNVDEIWLLDNGETWNRSDKNRPTEEISNTPLTAN